jgi:hypothetical protein
LRWSRREADIQRQRERAWRLGHGQRRQQVMHPAQLAQRLLALWTSRDVALKLGALDGAQLAVDIR